MIIDGLDTSRTYTADEVVEMARNGRLRSLTLKGWFFRSGINKPGVMELVHFTDPTANRMTPGSPGRGLQRVWEFEDPLPDMKAAVNSESPIVKRTPQQRLASLTTKLMNGERGQDAAAKMLLQMMAGTGAHDGLDDDAVKAITGASWKAGDPLDADTVRRVAARYLGQAEKQVAEQAREARTKAGRKARREQERLEASEIRAYKRAKKQREKNHENAKTQF